MANKENNLTQEQQELVDQIMEQESWQHKVDEIVARTQAEMEAPKD